MEAYCNMHLQQRAKTDKCVYVPSTVIWSNSFFDLSV